MPERTTQNAQTLLSPRVPRDTEHERYHPELEEELKECLFCLKRNEMMFDMEVDTDLIEQRIYERQALLCRYRYLLARARELGLHTVLTRYQPMGGGKGLGQHRTIPALRLKYHSGGCGTASALPKCSIIHKVLSALLA